MARNVFAAGNASMAEIKSAVLSLLQQFVVE
jgi:hypothetical protein